jgi:hypothetical protein
MSLVVENYFLLGFDDQAAAKSEPDHHGCMHAPSQNTSQFEHLRKIRSETGIMTSQPNSSP